MLRILRFLVPKNRNGYGFVPIDLIVVGYALNIIGSELNIGVNSIFKSLSEKCFI